MKPFIAVLAGAKSPTRLSDGAESPHRSEPRNQKLSGKTQGNGIPIAWERITPMLWTIFVVLLVLWFLGLVTSYTMGGFIHILLVLAIVAVLIQVFQGGKQIS